LDPVTGPGSAQDRAASTLPTAAAPELAKNRRRFHFIEASSEPVFGADRNSNDGKGYLAAATRLPIWSPNPLATSRSVSATMTMVVSQATKLKNGRLTWSPMSDFLLTSSSMKTRTGGRAIPLATCETNIV